MIRSDLVIDGCQSTDGLGIVIKDDYGSAF